MLSKLSEFSLFWVIEFRISFLILHYNLLPLMSKKLECDKHVLEDGIQLLVDNAPKSDSDKHSETSFSIEKSDA